MQNQVLVIYKNKVLLSAPDMPMQKCEWDFISKRTIQIRCVYQFVESTSKQTLAYIKLSDDNVNSLQRKNGQRMEFYSISEVEKLPLSEQALKLFILFKLEMLKLTL